ncbi:response regulator transcription factor [Nonomuraea sp. NBC_01738]|uniref:response regulator transcription factor n=1 Tax=Nonomuraea sp. NBC_01738 TaxID=2976003 RepID=UPI002E150EB1|nr:response regulator transcription factor [Nonomuraea sp. NBC_01738]
MSTRILIADDQDDVRIGFRLILDAQPDMTVVGEAADGLKAVELARHLRPDVVLADIRMPGLDGLEVTRLLSGETKVIVVTTFDLDEYVHTALRDGASGFLLKRSGPTLLIEAVRAAMAGDALISPQVTVRLLRHLRAPSAPAPDPLTAREREIARLVAHGRTNAAIADELFISAGTVKTHLANIQRKIGAANRVGIAAWAWSSGAA